MRLIRNFTTFIGAIGLVIIVGYLIAIGFLSLSYPVTKWDWSQINTENTKFPKDFLWGTATSAYQVEGNSENANWNEWEKSRYQDGAPHIKNAETAGLAADEWNLYAEDIELMQKIGVNSYRFSIAWNRIQPRKDKFSEEAFAQYDDMIDSLLARGIRPMITLHHFSHPQWFEELGGFEKQENISYFEQFARLVFRRYGDRVRMWCTFNEPNVYITNGYFNGTFPPGVRSPERAGQVFENILRAHVAVYKSLKEIDKKDFPQRPKLLIGLVQSTFQFEPLRRWHLGDWAIARTTSNVFNETTLGFFRNGTMNYWLPGIASRNYSDPSAPATLDFIGLNYYSHYAFRFNPDFSIATQPLPYPNEVMTDMPYTIYTEGIYRAIKDISSIGKPIIITENGIADATDDRREMYISQSLYAVSKAIADGYNVRGYYYWSLIDNFEWNEGYSMKFGLYKVDFETQQRSLRRGSQAFVDVVNRSR